jgi:nucleoside-diphosphate-sugar epimerase/1-acyl-sn-glycerol-3-phosphate acyltransferase
MSLATESGVRILLTGATGFVGKVVLEELMRRRTELGIERVYLLIRPRRNKPASERLAALAGSRAFSRLEPGWPEFCSAIAGDILESGLGIAHEDRDLLRKEVTHIIHCAASVRFDLPIREASAINITGALNVLELARECRNLVRLVDVSTAYVTPHPGGGVLEVEEQLVTIPLDAEETYELIRSGKASQGKLLATTGHPNTYTFTKCIAELLLAKKRGNVPLSLLRPSAVSACRRYPFPGWIDSHAAYAAFITLIGAGHLRVIRADANTVLDVVPCDDVAERIIACAFDPSAQQPLVVRHAVAGLSDSGTAVRLAQTHENHFRDTPPHDREPYLAYVGRSVGAYRFQRLMHHLLPLQAVKVTNQLTGKRRNAVKARRLAKALEYLDHAFYYFVHHTFDFKTVWPLDDFDLDSYLVSVSEGISEYLLKRNPRQAPLRLHGSDLRWAMKAPHGDGFTRFLAWVVRKALRAGRAHITIDETSIKAALRESTASDLIVLAPSHRSYLDFLVTSLLCFAQPALRLKLPKVAATDDFARIPIVGGMLRRGGAFYIKRGTGVPDPELTKHIIELVKEGHSLSFYAEGTRSRSRRFLLPKRGILRALQQAGRPTVIIPLSINYDRVAEEKGFRRELEDGQKHRSGMGPLLKWTRALIAGKIRLGRIHVRAGKAIRLNGDSDVKALSREIIAELQRNAVVTTHHVRAFCSMHKLDREAVSSAITRRGGMIVDSKIPDDHASSPALARTYEGQWMHLFYADALHRAPANPAVVAHVKRNGFWYPDAVHHDEITDDIVAALFRPICTDYQRVAEEVARMPADGSVTAHQLVARLRGVFLAEAEDALSDLAVRGVLTNEKGTYRWTAGPCDLSTHAADCAWLWPAAPVLIS